MDPGACSSNASTHGQGVDQLKFYGNNAFGNPYGKQGAIRALKDLRDTGGLDADYLLSAVLGNGVSASGVKNLMRIMERLKH